MTRRQGIIAAILLAILLALSAETVTKVEVLSVEETHQLQGLYKAVTDSQRAYATAMDDLCRAAEIIKHAHNTTPETAGGCGGKTFNQELPGKPTSHWQFSGDFRFLIHSVNTPGGKP